MSPILLPNVPRRVLWLEKPDHLFSLLFKVGVLVKLSFEVRIFYIGWVMELELVRKMRTVRFKEEKDRRVKIPTHSLSLGYPWRERVSPGSEIRSNYPSYHRGNQIFPLSPLPEMDPTLRPHNLLLVCKRIQGSKQEVLLIHFFGNRRTF